MKHTITIELEVPEGMAAAVGHEAHVATVQLNDHTHSRVHNLYESVRLIEFAARNSPGGIEPTVKSVIDRLSTQARRISDATAIVKVALSEIMHAMNEADMAERRAKAKP